MTHLVKRSHGGRRRRNRIVDKEEKGLFRTKMDPLADQKVKLTHSQVRGNQVLLLVHFIDPSLGSLLNNHLNNKDYNFNAIR